MRPIDIAAVLGLAISHVLGGDAGAEWIKLPLPSRPLEWKEVNFLSISDSHGWLLGHKHATWPEPNYSGDYGDFASFVEHMRRLADDRGQDLLLVDAGDHHDGSGLVSSSHDSANRADEIFNMVHYDIMTIGNHELYNYEPARWVYDHKDRFGGRYLTSNVEILVNGDYVPVGERYTKFNTTQGNRVTAFGIIFDFKAHGPGIKVQAPRAMVREQWFQDAIEGAPEYFVLVGHMPVRGPDSEFGLVIDAIRTRHPLVPIFVFGGHTHVRDCVVYDNRSIGVVPGRYIETVAFTSSSLPKDASEPWDMDRRYIDANRQSYKYHTDTLESPFDTPRGLNITTSLLRLASSLDISTPLGKAPHDYFLSRYPPGHPRHVITEVGDVVLPAVLHDKERKGKERVIIANTGTLRFDVFQGRFDRNDELTVSPFSSGFVYVPLPAGLASNITDAMNRAGASKLRSNYDDGHPRSREEIERGVDRVYDAWKADQWAAHLAKLGGEADGSQKVLDHDLKGRDDPTMGYVTHDLCPGKGDDIEHVPVPHFGPQPDFFSSPLPAVATDDELIDVVVCDFALDDFLSAVNNLAPALNLTWSDMKPYANGMRTSEVLGQYAKQYWN